MRELIYVPIAHEPSDFHIYTQRNTAKQHPYFTKTYQSNLQKYWNKIDSFLLDKEVHKIYQDSFQETGRGIEKDINEFILKSLSKRNISRNYNSITDLMNKGAIPIVTESYKLLDEFDRNMHKDIISTINRDNFILRRIDQTLEDNETGVLFLGVGHTIEAYFNQVNNLKVTKFTDKKILKEIIDLVSNVRQYTNSQRTNIKKIRKTIEQSYNK
ncbi:MAG TPA: hypothetical protein VEC16_02215 [Alphaproteobacteria bacterium]|nr:hypothetical protein [Alphaproteobacteria bacterium]